MRNLPLLFALFALTSCTPTPEPSNYAVKDQKDGRIKVVSYQEFFDGNQNRFIVVLQDSKTNREYLAVNGAGVYDLDCSNNGCTEK